MADTISQSLAFRLNPDSPTELLSFLPFNLSLGTLESVAINFDATRRHDLALWNFSDHVAAVVYNASLTGTTLSLDGTAFNFTDLTYAGNTGLLAPVTLPGFASEFQAGRSQFLAGLDPVYPSAFHPAPTLTNFAGPYAPLSFTGSLDLSYDPGFFSISGDNFLSSSLVDVTGTATVTYTFKTVSVPDSALGLSVAALWIGMMAVARVRRSELQKAD